jgi:hypothetical protein
LADRLGLTECLTAALRVHSRTVRHEPGRVACGLAVMLAGGGDCLTDLGALRDQEVLFGQVASDVTAYRCVERLGKEILVQIRKARAAARARARAHSMNAAWLGLVLVGSDLLAWTRPLLSGTDLAACELKSLRHRLLHVAGRRDRCEGAPGPAAACLHAGCARRRAPLRARAAGCEGPATALKGEPGSIRERSRSAPDREELVRIGTPR